MGNILHSKQTISDGIHIPYSWTYADTTARTAASGFVAGDVGKFARQLDDNSIWMLTATTPNWSRIDANGITATSLGALVSIDGVSNAGGNIDLVAGTNITITPDDSANTITISASSAGEANTASNVGTAGVGIFKQKAGTELEFKKLNAGSSAITITDDTSNDEVDIDISAGNISHDSLNGAGTNTHSQIDTHLSATAPHSGHELTANKGVASGYASLNASSKVVEDPANATSTPTGSRIPISDTSAKLDGWVTYAPGGTDIAILDGGTGASDKTTAFDNLSPTTTKGDVIVYNGADNIRLAVGTDGQVLTADSATASGIKWAAASGGGGGISATDHQTLRQLIHFIDNGPAEGFATGAYREIVGNPFPTSITWWETSSKLKKIVEKTIARNANKTPSTITWRVYDTDGTTVLATVTDTLTYSGIFETSRSRSIA